MAGYLLLRHHSAVELAQRAEGLGLIQRVADRDDGRVVRLVLTDTGNSALEQLSALHVEELARLANDLGPVWDGLETTATDRP
jgi:DNA-binding MarR family transcriptional regulator